MRLALGTLLAFGLVAAPASAADVNIGGFEFSPARVEINQGESVVWHFRGPDTNHSVTSRSGQADSWDSDPGRNPTNADHPPGTTYERQFLIAGSFSYFCKVHPGMTGSVVVKAPGGTEPPPPADATAPALTNVSARRVRRPKPIRLRFTLDEDATVKVVGPKKRTATRALAAGSHTIKLSTRKLRRGRYKLTLTATDAAGNSSAPKTVKARVR